MTPEQTRAFVARMKAAGLITIRETPNPASTDPSVLASALAEPAPAPKRPMGRTPGWKPEPTTN